jgi:hypothetical protein
VHRNERQLRRRACVADCDQGRFARLTVVEWQESEAGLAPASGT